MALRAKDIKLGALQMDLDSIEAEHQTVLDEKHRRLVDAEEAYNATLDLMEEGRDERETSPHRSQGPQNRSPGR